MRFDRKWPVAIALLAAIILLASCSKKKKPFLFLPLAEGGSGTSLPIGDGSTPASEDQSANAEIADQTGETDFNFQTTQEITVDVTITDPNGPVDGAIVNITDPDQGGISVFQGVTDENGNVSGHLTIPTTSDELELVVQVGETVATQPISTDNLIGIDRDIEFTQPTDATQIADADADGVPDGLDYYPQDATRSSRLIYPAGGVSVVAFEDLYPTAGDADFNDFVVQVKNEEDRDAKGQVVRLRGEYRVLARGAGYKHNLFLNLPGHGVAHIVVRDGAGQVVADLTRSLSSFEALPVFPKSIDYFANPAMGSAALFDSSVLCPGICNVYEGSQYVKGYTAEVEVIFEEPAPTLSAAPYDLFIYVLNTQKQIHFPGMVAGATDPYIDANGFPWALKMPAEWNWPLEKKHIESGYPQFKSWYESRGATNRDWYLQTTPESSDNLYRYFSRSPIAAYVLQYGLSHQSLLWAFVSVMLTGLIVLLFLKGRSEFEA